MPDTILVTGATGLLGRALMRALGDHPETIVVGTGLNRASGAIERLDILDADAVEKFTASLRPQVIIHAAAERHHRLANMHQFAGLCADRVHGQETARWGVEKQLQEAGLVAQHLPARYLAVEAAAGHVIHARGVQLRPLGQRSARYCVYFLINTSSTTGLPSSFLSTRVNSSQCPKWEQSSPPSVGTA